MFSSIPLHAFAWSLLEVFKMKWKILFEVLILVIVLGVVFGILIISGQGKLIIPFENKTELVSSCEMWNCAEPIPIDISSGLNCSTIEDCKEKCRGIGANMLRCRE